MAKTDWRKLAREAAAKVDAEFPDRYPRIKSIIRGNPTDEEIKAAIEEAKALLNGQVPKGFQYCLW